MTTPSQPDRSLRRDRRAGRRAFAAGGALLVLALIGAACGSSNSSNSSSKPSSTAASPTSVTTTTGTTANSATSAFGTGLSGAEAFAAKYEQQPTQINITTPITKAIPKGKIMYFIPCGPNPECQQEGQIVKQAGDLLGWTTVVPPNDGTPQGDQAAFEDAIRGGANAILYTAIDESIFSSLVPQMQAKGIVLSACCNLYPAGSDQVIYDIDTPSESAPVAYGQSALIASASKCQNADSVDVIIPDFTILKESFPTFGKALKNYCPSATPSELDIALANLATGPSTIVSYLRAHPSVHYIVMSTDSLADGLPAALKAAGLSSSAHIVGNGATPTNIQYLKASQEAGDTGFAYDTIMYGMVDAVARHYAGVPVLPSTSPPLWLLTPQNSPAPSNSVFPVVPNYKAQFEKLWGLG